MIKQSRKVIDETRGRYGRLKVIAFAGMNKRGQARWLCQCKCGKRSVVVGTDLRSGHTKSCGCLLFTFCAKHGHCRRRSPVYRSWDAMIQRCTNPNNARWKNYGGRGIGVCRRWRGPNGFTNFLADMGRRPKGKTLDRIKNNVGYRPSNCRWRTPKQQQNNRRNTPTKRAA
jgi:hypothetical protein